MKYIFEKFTIYHLPFTIAQTGQSLIELLVAIGLTTILIPAVLTGLVASREGKAQEGQRLEASTLITEAQEAVRSVREKGWQYVVAGTYHPVISGTSWSLSAGVQTLPTGYQRSIVINDVARDITNPNWPITTSGGTNDTSTKKVDITVSWTTPQNGSLTSMSYLSRYVANTVWSQTTQAHFNTGTLTNTITTANGGGTVELAPSGGGDWASSQPIYTHNNPGTANANDVFVSGDYAYVVYDDGGSNADFRIINITNRESPVPAGSLNLNTNVRGIYVVNDYAFLATTHDTKELIVINVANKSNPTEVASRDLGSTQDATAIFVDSSNFAYITKLSGTGSNREMYIYNVGTSTNPTSAGSYEVGANVNSVFVSDDYAYLATADNGQELIRVNISNKSSIGPAVTFNAPGSADGLDVFISGTRAYLVTQSDGSTNPEFYILDASNISASLGSYNVTNTANGVFVTGNFAFLATAVTGKQFLVLDITAPTPVEYGFFNITSTTNDLYISGDYAYVASTNDGAEFRVLKGGAGPYVTSGTFESQVFDATIEVAFNYFTFTVTQPANTTIQLQLAISNSSSGPWNYFGPNGLGTSYGAPGQIPLTLINGRYIRYKATLTGNGKVTPVLTDTNINYSP